MGEEVRFVDVEMWMTETRGQEGTMGVDGVGWRPRYDFRVVRVDGRDFTGADGDVPAAASWCTREASVGDEVDG